MFYRFIRKQISACIFGIALLFGIVASRMLWQADWSVARYDALLVYAIIIQVLLLAYKLETWREARVIIVFHIVGTVMELFKTSVGSWNYPEENFFRIAGVPLFSGFMYSAVGSYIARSWRLFDCRFVHYPKLWISFALGAAIYVNFFTHHIFVDMRYALIAAIIILYHKTILFFTIDVKQYSLPLLIPFVMLALLLWAAENIATYNNIWLYPHQMDAWEMVSFHKMESWFLLMLLSFVLVSINHKPTLADKGMIR